MMPFLSTHLYSSARAGAAAKTSAARAREIRRAAMATSLDPAAPDVCFHLLPPRLGPGLGPGQAAARGRPAEALLREDLAGGGVAVDRELGAPGRDEGAVGPERPVHRAGR